MLINKIEHLSRLYLRAWKPLVIFKMKWFLTLLCKKRQRILDFSFLSNKTPPLVGVDISTSAVKMVQLAGDKRTGFTLEAYATSPLDKDSVVDGHIKDLEKVSETVERTWKLISTKVKRTALALPTANVISKKVLMPANLNEDELNNHVEAEANQYIPFSLDEVNIDFQALNEFDQETESQSVLIVAAKKENIEDRVAAAEGADLSVEIMDVESYATEAAYTLVANTLPKKGKDKRIMIVDIGATMTHINVMLNGESLYTRDQHFGGNQLTQNIQRRYGLTTEESEISKRNGDLPDSYESEVLTPFKQQIINEIQRAQQFYQTAGGNNHQIDHFILAGGCASIAGIREQIETETGITTTVANPFEQMSLNKRISSEKLNQDAPSLFVACGLAMRGLAL